MLSLLALTLHAQAAPVFFDTGLVLRAPSSGSFTGGINAPTVDFDRFTGQYVMYFESPQSSIPTTCVNAYAIGRATSSNGIVWTVTATPVLQADSISGSNRECGVSQPSVVFDGTTWHLFFSQSRAAASSTATSNESGGIGYATSTDGVNFTVVSDPMIPPSTDRRYPVGLASAVINNGDFYVLYDQYPDVHLATAPTDLSTGWSLEGVVMDHSAFSWSTTWLFGPSLLCTPGTAFEAFVGGDATSRSVGWASSPNAWDWTWGASPLTAGTVPWNSLNHWDMLRNRDGSMYFMWYSMTDSATGKKAVGFASTRPRRGRILGHYCAPFSPT
jgi:hypothetical protein